ncbi:MAG: hypothetical protein WDO18_13115 [Acidobacteriota bacterium]
MGKAFADIRVTSKFNLDLNLTAFSSSFARGNENNQHKADGVVYLGPRQVRRLRRDQPGWPLPTPPPSRTLRSDHESGGS